MFKNILVPVDMGHMERTDAMIDSIKSIVGQSDVNVTFLHVMAVIPGYIASQIPASLHQTAMTESKNSLQVLAHASELANTAKVMVEEGNASQVILKTAKNLNADLIVIGSHKPGAADYLLGSVAGKVVRHASCSVMVIR